MLTDDLSLEEKDSYKTMSDASFLIQRLANPNAREVKTEKKVRANASLRSLYLGVFDPGYHIRT